jgi:RNA-directed DNA polymerase
MKPLLLYTGGDGETKITELGCILAIIFSPVIIPLVIIFGFVSSLFYNISDKDKKSSAIVSYEQRCQNRFFNHSRIKPQDFWNITPEYKTVHIPKKSGGTRVLHVPDDATKALLSAVNMLFQKELNKHISSVAHAFRPYRSTVTNARPHLGCVVLIKLDIKDFFPSVRAEHIRPSIELATYSSKVQDRLLELVLHEGALPQGAPTSPILSNLALKPFDTKIASICHFYGFKYTRYADDISISMNKDDPKAIKMMIAIVDNELTKIGFKLNKKPQKLHVLRSHQAQRICGITINSGKPTITRKRRRLLRAAAHRLKTTGETSLSQNALMGWNSYVHMVHSANDCAWCNDERNAPKAVFCPQCEFVSKKHSAVGLARHWKSKHPEHVLQELPRCKYHQHVLT